MTPEEAYRIVCDAIASSPSKHIVSHSFDPDVFGNFVIEFTDLTEERLIVCDRGQVFAGDDFEGDKNYRLVVPTLRDVTKPELLKSVRLDFPLEQ